MGETTCHWLTEETVAYVCNYMNKYQADSVIEIAARHGVARPDTAVISGFDYDSVMLIEAGNQVTRIPWSVPLQSRDQIRSELLALAGY
jgi:uncharacterized protein with GYD domain